jgi:hypothetical protein
VGIVVLAILATLFTRGCDNEADNKPKAEKATNKPIGTKDLSPKDVTVTGQKVPTDIKAVKSTATPYPAADKLTDALTSVYEITPSGKLAAPMTITFRFDRTVKPGNTVVVMTNTLHTKEGWVPVAAKLSKDRKSASIVVAHLSWFQALEDLVGNTADTFMSEVRRNFDDLMGGATAEANKPKCENEKQARGDGYTIDSSSKATLYWCFGIQDGKRILKVVNRMRYPLDVRHPGLKPLKLPKHLELASLAAVTAGKNVILFPFDEATFVVDMNQGGSGVLRTSHSGTAQSLYQLQVGVTTLLDILTRFGAGGSPIANGAYTVGKYDRVIEKVDKLLAIPECASAIESFTAGKLFTKCLSPELVLRFFGPWAVFVAPAMVVGPLVEFFRSELNVIGDELNGRSKYGIVIRRGKMLKFYNLTILLQSGWDNKPISGAGEGQDSKDIRTGACHNDQYGLMWCQGFYVFGPNGGKVGHPLVSYDPQYAWEPYTDARACPMYADRFRSGYISPVETQLHEGTAKIGARTVRYNEWKVGCAAMDGSDDGNPAKFFVQKVWYDPQSGIFIVDEWDTPGLKEALANARWN